MKQRILTPWSVSLILILTFALAVSAEARESFGAELSGNAEVPPVETDTTGAFRFRYDDFDSTAAYRLRVRDGVRITQAHLHCGLEGENGPPIIFLAGFHENGWDVNGNWVDNATVTDDNIFNDVCGATLAEIVEAIRNGNVYVNVHSVANPGGEIRGQVR